MSLWVIVPLAMAALAGLGAVYQALGARADRRRFPPPGRMVTVGAHQLHVMEAGVGSPTVLFEAALGASAISWCRVQPEIAKLTRTFAYDRTGMGFSEAGPLPRTAERIAEELHALLSAARVPGPYILVGHSYGGMVARLYAHQHPQEVEGMVLLDPAHPQEWLKRTREQRRKLWAGAMLARRGAWIARLGIARLTAVLAQRGARRSAKVVAATVSGGILAGRSERMIAPIDRVLPELRPALAAIWTQPKFYWSLASQIEHMTQSAQQVAETKLPAELPLVVLSADSLPAHEVEQHRSVAAASARGQHQVVKDSGHWIQLDQPQAVVAAITALIELVWERS
jgi:pimeloyl-ACP methyl ester carboxylesterase